MGETRLPDPHRSRALLFGASQFTDLGLLALPAVQHNLADLAALLTSPSGTGLPGAHCVVLSDEPNPAVIGGHLHSLAAVAEDLLLVYYAGHGVVGPDGELYLSLPGTRQDRGMVAWTGLPFSLLRRTLAEAGAANRVLILDCCFSGLAIDAMADTASAVAGQMEISGTCTLTSSPANQVSLAPAGAVHTAFTGELLRILRNGAPGQTGPLTLREIHEHLARELPRRGFPRPEQRNTRTVANLALAASPKLSPADPAPDREREQALRQGTDAGDVETMNSQGVLLLERGDIEGAEHWYRRAAEAGDAAAMNNLGTLLHDRRGDVEEAEHWIRKAAEAGDVDAMYNLGTLLRDRRGDVEGAEHWFRRAAEAGDAAAMYNVGTLQHGRRGDVEGAEHWFRKAAEAGDDKAMTSLGLLHDRRGDVKEAEHWFRKAVETGDAKAMKNLGLLLLQRGDVEGAQRWFRKPAEVGRAKVMNERGVLLQQRGDVEGAEREYRKAAEIGHPDAMNNLGLLLQQRGNVEEAQRWYRKATEAGAPM